MIKRKLLPLFSLLVIISLFLKPTNIQSVNLSLTDPTNDLIHKIDGATVLYNVTVQPDIDIISLEINDTIIAVTFQAVPILSLDNWYDFIIYWNGQDVQNFTDGHWNMGHVISSTKLVNSTGDIIVHTTESDIIETIGNTIYYPILNHSLVVTDLDPVNMIMDARHRTGPGAEYYQDVLEYNVGTAIVPGYRFFVSILGISVICVILTTKKKR